MGRPRDFHSLQPLHQLWLLSLAQGDFAQSASAARLALDLPGEDSDVARMATYQALGECAITRYARPFSRSILPQARAAGARHAPQLSSRLDDEWVSATGVPNAMSVHRKALELRDTLVAHSDAQAKSFKVTKAQRMGETFIYTTSQVAHLHPSNLELLNRLARALASSLSSRIAQLTDEVLPGLAVDQEATVRFRPEGTRYL